MKNFSMTTVLALAAGVSSAVAAPLNLSPLPPDVASGFIVINYNASSMVFTATGFTQNISLPGPSSQPAGLREFSLSAVIDNAGNATSGTLLVKTDFGSNDSVAFQSASLTAFGFGAFNKFEFVFSQAAGNLAAVGSEIGTILVSPSLSFPGNVPSFAQSFTNDPFGLGFGDGNADTFLIPAPGALALLGMGGLVSTRRRR
jgi:hypothetical protein